jgi:hypothetical protein
VQSLRRWRAQTHRAEAAKLLEELTGAHRTSCYRALRLKAGLPGICVLRVERFSGADL